MTRKKVTEGEWQTTYKDRMYWLKQMDRRPGDVMEDEKGREYVYADRDEHGKCARIYLPTDLFLPEISEKNEV